MEGGTSMRIALCDDSAQQLEQLRGMLLAWEGRHGDLTITCYDNGEALIQAHAAVPFDVIFLDVLMPLLGGMETARELRRSDKTVKLVFLTSSSDFAVEAFSVKASNYLLKPLDVQNLHRCLEELADELRASSRKICIKGIHALHQIPTADIEYIESQNKHILFVLSTGETIRSGEPLYTYEEKLTLQDGFFKCSRSFIVNIHRIDTFTAKEIRTRSGARIPISRSCQREFENAYFSVLFGKAGEKL
jgi:DNA-binding LytR/AlgR family response regulator